jgi:hypothetical protein
MTQAITSPDWAESSDDDDGVQPRVRGLLDRMDPRIVGLLTVLGFGLPAIGYFYVLSRYSLNTIVGDQFDDLNVIRNSYAHLFDWSSLWAPHNENRLFFPNLIVEVLARTTHFNVQVEEYLGALMLMAATALLIWAHKRRSPSSPWLYYCPVVFLLLSIVQWQNTLWGFQMAWYLVLLCLAGCLVLLDRAILGWVAFVCALAVGVIGSFSSLQGLIIWPAGLILLYHRRRHWPFVTGWIAVGIGSAVLYFHNFNSAAGPRPNFPLEHPLLMTRFFLLLVGDILGVPLSSAHPTNDAVMLFGLIVVGVAVVTVLLYGFRRDEDGPGPIGIALICYGLLFGLTVTQGRLIYGYVGAGASRYTTFDLLILVGIFFAVLGRAPVRNRAKNFAGEPTTVAPHWALRLSWTATYNWLQNAGLKVARWLVLGLIVVQILAGFHYGPTGAKNNYVFKAQGAELLKNFKRSPNSQLQYYLYVFESPAWIRMQAQFAEEHHLSLFDESGP